MKEAHEESGQDRGKGFRVFSLQEAREGAGLAEEEEGLAGGGREEPAGDPWPCWSGGAQAHSPEIFPATCTPMVTPKPKPKLTPR